MITLVINEDEYRYGIGQLCTVNGIKLFDAMYYTYYSYKYYTCPPIR